MPKVVIGADDRTLSSAEARADYFRARAGLSRQIGSLLPRLTPAKAPSSEGECAEAATHWKSESINTLAVYEDHLQRFPNCAFATLAKTKIEALKK